LANAFVRGVQKLPGIKKRFACQRQKKWGAGYRTRAVWQMKCVNEFAKIICAARLAEA